MIEAPETATMVAVLLAAAVLLASLRLLLQARAGHLAPGRCAGILVLQALAAVLLHLVMFPPDGVREAGLMTVLARGATTEDARGVVVALPEFDGRAGDRVPDLAGALRRHPGTTRIVVRGAGLPWRDHDAARGVDVTFEPSPAPAGLASLSQPRRVVAGQRIVLRGQVAGVDRARIELRDPAGGRAARAIAADDGRFSLALDVRAAGAMALELRVLDADDVLVDAVPVALTASAGQPLRTLLLAAAPSAELRALRRWAVDAGVALESRIQLSRDIHLGAAPVLEPAELGELDLLLLDTRVWRSLDRAQREAVGAAVREGLGLLLRVDGDLDEDHREALAMLGFDAWTRETDETGIVLHPEHLGHSDDRAKSGSTDPEDPPTLSRRPLRVASADAAVLLRSDEDEPLALWRGEGRGRVALWWLDATHPLTRHADPAIHAGLWSRVVSTLARARSPARFEPGTDAGLHVRRVLCGLGRGARVEDPGGGVVELIVDSRACAAYWPAHAGWHAMIDEGRRSAFHVAIDGARADHAMREATAVLASRPGRVHATTMAPVPGSPWPWWLAFLATVAALWWLERRRVAPRTDT